MFEGEREVREREREREREFSDGNLDIQIG
jgi:hypothetical protein